MNPSRRSTGVTELHVKWLLIAVIVALATTAPALPATMLAAVPSISPRGLNSNTLLGQWRTRRNMPTPRGGLGLAAGTSGKLYAIGGSTGDRTAVEEYDPSANTWASRARMPTGRGNLGTVTARSGRIYAIGGQSVAGNKLPTVEEYDPMADTWTPRAPMPTARSSLGVAVGTNGRIYAVGGCCTWNNGSLSTVEEYDPNTDTWATRSSMAVPRMYVGVAAASSGRIYAIGGDCNCGSRLLRTVEGYDPVTDAWETLTSMPTARAWFATVGAPNGKIYAIGGGLGGGVYLSAVEEYDPDVDTWAGTTSMRTERANLGAAVTADWKLYAIGGSGAGSFGDLPTVEEATITGAEATAPPGAAKVIPIPGNHGSIAMPVGAAGNRSVRVQTLIVPVTPTVPSAISVLRVVDITLKDSTTGVVIPELERDATIEMSYAGLGAEDRLGVLVIFNATRGEYLPTTIDPARQLAIARTRRFSTFTLAQAILPIPRLSLPVALK